MAEKSTGINLNSEELKRFFKRYGVILLLLLPIFLSAWFRAYTYSLPVTDEWAEQSVYSNIRLSITNQIEAKYPDLLSENKEVLVEKEFQRTLKDQKKEIEIQ